MEEEFQTPSGLYAHISFIEADEMTRSFICNGCGSAESKFDFVPDSIYGLPISEVCDIHDWDYRFGRTEKDRLKADFRMLGNLVVLIEKHSGKMLAIPRMYRACTYFIAVRRFGSKAFWIRKDPEGNYKDS